MANGEQNEISCISDLRDHKLKTQGTQGTQGGGLPACHHGERPPACRSPSSFRPLQGPFSRMFHEALGGHSTTVACRAGQEGPGAMSSLIRRLSRAGERSVERVELIERALETFSGYQSAREGRPVWPSGIRARGPRYRAEPWAGRGRAGNPRARQGMEHFTWNMGKQPRTQWESVAKPNIRNKRALTASHSPREGERQAREGLVGQETSAMRAMLAARPRGARSRRRPWIMSYAPTIRRYDRSKINTGRSGPDTRGVLDPRPSR